MSKLDLQKYQSNFVTSSRLLQHNGFLSLFGFNLLHHMNINVEQRCRKYLHISFSCGSLTDRHCQVIWLPPGDLMRFQLLPPGPWSPRDDWATQSKSHSSSVRFSCGVGSGSCTAATALLRSCVSVCWLRFRLEFTAVQLCALVPLVVAVTGVWVRDLTISRSFHWSSLESLHSNHYWYFRS